jgi:two-component system sensor histidine kinase GlrK
VLRTPDSLQLLRQDLATVYSRLEAMQAIAERAGATVLLESVAASSGEIVNTLAANNLTDENAQAAVEKFSTLKQDVTSLTREIGQFVETELRSLQASTREAQRISAWQVAALVPGTLVLVLFFIVLVARPIRQIDKAIDQLGQSGFAKPIVVKGPSDLEKLGRQLEWLRLRLLELAQEKNRFLRHMSHELKTPLASIREGTELLLDGTLGELDPPQSEVADILRMNGMKLQQLIENLLSFSAWQTKNEVLTLSEFPLRALVISVAKEQRLALKAAGIQLRLEVDDIMVTADRDKMRTAMDNLLSNAVKFTPKGGFVTIRATQSESSFVIDFADTGPGIPDDEGPRIFDAFFQGRREQGGQVAGTGIGLSVVLECIQAHGGAVTLIQSDEFPGAHFRIEIPQQRTVQTEKIAANA